jgi:hypothetical protein
LHGSPPGGEAPPGAPDESPIPLRWCDWDGLHRCPSPAVAQLVAADSRPRWLCDRHVRLVLEWHRANAVPLPALRWIGEHPGEGDPDLRPPAPSSD